eukprot:SAG31_NODE_16873_length_692_cov_0.959528_1_plen_94_part_00
MSGGASRGRWRNRLRRQHIRHLITIQGQIEHCNAIGDDLYPPDAGCSRRRAAAAAAVIAGGVTRVMIGRPRRGVRTEGLIYLPHRARHTATQQ